MTPPTCPLGTSWCTEYEPADAVEERAECVRVVGVVRLDPGHGPRGRRGP